jgi:hypothetical protein
MVFIPPTSRVCGNRSSRSLLCCFAFCAIAALVFSSLVFRRGALEFCFLSRPLLERRGEFFFLGWVLGGGAGGGLLGVCLGGLVT